MCTVNYIYWHGGGEGALGLFIYSTAVLSYQDICTDYCIDEMLFTSKSLLQWNLSSTLWELKKGILRLPVRSGWPIIKVYRPVSSEELINCFHSETQRPHLAITILLPESPDLVLYGSHLIFEAVPAEWKNIIFFYRWLLQCFLSSRNRQGTKETLHLNNIHPQVLPQSVLLWPANIRWVGVRYHPNKMIHCPEKLIM